MIVMPSNNSKSIVHYWAGRGFNVGWLFTPEGTKVRDAVPWMPYAIDNGRYAVWSKGGDWNERAFTTLLEFYHTQPIKPNFVTVPDAVGNREQTLKDWDEWYPVLKRSFDYDFAFVVQDGMTPDDVPEEADLVFVGGTFKWKWKTVADWASSFDRVHVGAVNTQRHLHYCAELLVESVDGTGWFRHPSRTAELDQFLKQQNGELDMPVNPQLELAL